MDPLTWDTKEEQEGTEGAARCRRGTIHRKGYTRKAYRRSDGSRVKTVHVRGKCIKDRGARGEWAEKHGVGIGKLKIGELSRVGYSPRKTVRSRHTAVNKASRRYGALSTYRKLNALATYTKRTSPVLSKKVKADRNYVGKQHGYKH